MLFTHRFGSAESLSRARYWMSRLGFEIASNNEESHDVSRLSLNIDFTKAAAAMALIDSIEASDPEGWPGMMTRKRMSHAGHDLQSSSLKDGLNSPARTPIQWHHRDEVSTTDPQATKVAEYMFSRWE